MWDWFHFTLTSTVLRALVSSLFLSVLKQALIQQLFVPNEDTTCKFSLPAHCLLVAWEYRECLMACLVFLEHSEMVSGWHLERMNFMETALTWVEQDDVQGDVVEMGVQSGEDS